MARPRKPDTLSPENMLSRMVPGVTYQANNLAMKFHLPVAEVRPMLDQMVADGLLVVSRASAKNMGYKNPNVPEVAPVPDTIVDGIVLTVATRREPPDLSGTLTGCEDAFRRHAQLCMLARGAR